MYTQTATHIIIYTNNIITKNNAHNQYYIHSYTYNIKNNARDRDTNYFSKFLSNCWCGEWLIVNEKMDINGRPK